jgi:hypothetical protein
MLILISMSFQCLANRRTTSCMHARHTAGHLIIYCSQYAAESLHVYMLVHMYVCMYVCIHAYACRHQNY